MNMESVKNFEYDFLGQKKLSSMFFSLTVYMKVTDF